MTSLLTYAGIGSRDTPDIVQEWIEQISLALMARGFKVNSGNAKGADKAFTRRIPVQARRIYLPRSGFGGPTPDAVIPEQWDTWARAVEIAKSVHPYWDKLAAYDIQFMGRNTHQILGDDLETPVQFAMLWAPRPVIRDGKLVDVDGGTGQAVRLAASLGIAAYNLGIPDHRAKIGATLGLTFPDTCPEADVRLVKPRVPKVR